MRYVVDFPPVVTFDPFRSAPLSVVELLRTLRRRQSLPAGAASTFVQTLRINLRRHISISIGRYFPGVGGYHPDNKAAGETLLRVLQRELGGKLGKIGYDDHIESQLDGDLIALGGANSTGVTTLAFEYDQEGELELVHPYDRGEKPKLPLAYYCLSDQRQVPEIVAVNDGTSIPGPNWPMRGVRSDWAKPKYEGLLWPQTSEKEGLVHQGQFLPFVRNDHLLITRIPNLLTSRLASLITREPNEWPYLIVADGGHGFGTKAIELLLSASGSKELHQAQAQLGDDCWFQILFEVNDVRVTSDGVHEAHGIRLLDVVPLSHDPAIFLTASQVIFAKLEKRGFDRIADSSHASSHASAPPGRRGRSSPASSPRHEQGKSMTAFDRVLLTTDLGDSDNLLNLIASLNQELREVSKPIKLKLERTLRRLEGKEFGSLARNQQAAAAIQELCHLLNVRIACPKCGSPSNISCNAVRGMENGAFKFRHPVGGVHQHHFTGTVLPQMKLVKAPPALRRSIRRR